jgi:hypothetical protein
MEDLFESAIRSSGDLAGVFEFDGETGYFYLYRLNAPEGNKVLDAIKITVGRPPYSAADLTIEWSADDLLVCLKIAGRVCAVFDTQGPHKFGGTYVPGRDSEVPPAVLERFG